MNEYEKLSEDELIKKINYYSKKARERKLDEHETLDRQSLRNEYLRRIRISLRSNLDNIQMI